jgi:hypothetical protein
VRRLMIWLTVLAGVIALGAGAFALFIRDRPVAVEQYRTMCEKPRGFKQAATLSATPPHPVFVDGYWIIRANNREMFSAAELEVWAPINPAKVQLVACVRNIGRGEFVKRCDYTGTSNRHSVNLYKTNLQVTVYEARTGKHVATVQIAGDNFGATQDRPIDPCPDTLYVRASNPPNTDRDGEPYIREIQNALAPHVTR